MISVDKIIEDYTIVREHHDGLGRLYRITLKSGEVYLFPSITTVLSFKPKDYIQMWKKAVGEEYAYAVTNNATERGTELHLYCEYIMLRDFAKAKEVFDKCKDRFVKNYIKKITPYLKKLNPVVASEEFLFSLKHGLAGTVDGVAYYTDGKIYIIDFKTSKNMKEKNSIQDYYVQVASYSIMFQEITGIEVNDGLILMVTPQGVQEFIFDIKPYKGLFLELLSEYYSVNGDKIKSLI